VFDVWCVCVVCVCVCGCGVGGVGGVWVGGVCVWGGGFLTAFSFKSLTSVYSCGLVNFPNS